MTKLHDLYSTERQSPWLDNLRRQFLTSGELQRHVDSGIRGVTSNPTIFQKAIEASEDYDEQFKALLAKGSVDDAYWELVISDVTDALGILRPVYDASNGEDGFVSLEVAPSLAADTEGTTTMARTFHERIDQPNLYVKIPATQQGVPAIQRMQAEGRNINITLIFGIERYDAVIEGYLSGLEAYGGDLTKVRSVASFFISRVDTEVDRRLDAIGTEAALALRGKAAVAQAKLAYQLFRQRFSGPRWEALAARGANLQRPLWASTSTKNKAYPDLLYVDGLIGPDTVNTMPDSTVEAYLDHGTVAGTVEQGIEEAQRVIDQLGELGVDLADVAATLEDEGVASFTKSFDELMQALNDKANALQGRQ